MLIWDERRGVGYYPVDDSDAPYDESYFKKYQGYADTDFGHRINDHRLGIVDKFAGGLPVLDVGIGCGQFVEARGSNTFGCDINPNGVEWLKDRGLLRSIDEPVECMTFWDSLEHFHRPDKVLANVKHLAFMSIPIFNGYDHVLSSKHFRTDEHFWYFTERGLLDFMREQSFSYLHIDNVESKIGREDIKTYVFERR